MDEANWMLIAAAITTVATVLIARATMMQFNLTAAAREPLVTIHQNKASGTISVSFHLDQADGMAWEITGLKIRAPRDASISLGPQAAIGRRCLDLKADGMCCPALKVYPRSPSSKEVTFVLSARSRRARRWTTRCIRRVTLMD